MESKNRAPVLVRAPRESDFETWLKLWDLYNLFYRRAGPTAIAREVTQSTWNRFFDAQEPVRACLAEVEGQIVGFTHYLFHRNTTLIEDTCYLQDLFTLESMRGRGIARALITEVYAKAHARGSPRVYWLTHESNETAMKLYDQIATRSGFLVYSKKL